MLIKTIGLTNYFTKEYTVHKQENWHVCLSQQAVQGNMLEKLSKKVCKSAGVTMNGNMSSHTILRAILEGGIAAQVQIGHELAQADGK